MTAVERLPWRLARRGALLLCASGALYAVVEAVSYEQTYPDAAAREQLARLSDSAAVRALQGVPRAIETTGGFVVWDGGWFLALVVSIWAVLATTRLLRGEEDTGRADLVLSRPVAARRLLRAQLSVVAAVAVGFGLVTAAALVAVGVEIQGSLLFGAGLAGSGLTAAAVAALAAQLLDVRRRAVAAGLAVLGIAFVVRMQGNSAPSQEWLLQLTPLGWLDRLEPFAENRWSGLLPYAAATAALTVLAFRERRRRDTGAARFSGRSSRAPRLRLLGGPVAFGWRTTQGVLASWCVGILLFGVMTGSIVSTVVELIEDDPEYARTLEDFGVDVSSPAEGFLSLMAIALALAFALYVSWRIGSLRGEEAAGRLDHLLVRPVSRSRWLAGYFLLSVLAAALVVLSGAIGVWLGARIGGTQLGWQEAIGPLLATLPLVVLFAGAGVLAFGAAPRLTVAVPAALAVLGYLLDLFGPLLSLPDVVLDLSPFHWLPRPPLEPWTAGPAVALTGLGVLLAAVGVAAFRRRDLSPD